MNVQTEYYIRLLLLLVQCGMLVCRGVTEREMAGTALDVFLKPHEPKLKKKLLKSQYLILFQGQPGKPDVEDLDLSLLTVVLLDVFNLPNETQYIMVIKKTRNTLSHNATASLVEADYTTMKIDLENALIKLTSGLDMKVQSECSQLIKKFTSEPLDESTALKYVKDLHNEDELLQEFEGMLERQSEDILQEINTSLSGMEVRLSTEIQKLQIGFTSENNTYLKFSDTLPLCEICIHVDNSKTCAFFCEDCSKFLCSDCYQNIHTSKEIHRRQKIVKGKSIKIDAKGYDVCFEHRKPLEYLCELENDLCCEVCLDQKHAQCDDIVSLSETDYEPKINISMEIARLRNETSLLTGWVSSIESDILVDNNLENISSRLADCRKSLLEIFDAEAQKVRDNAADMRSNVLNDIKRKQKSFDKMQEKIEQAKVNLINMSKCGTVCQKRVAQFRIEQFVNTFKSLKELNIASYRPGPINLPDHILQQPASRSQYIVNVPETRPVRLSKISQFEFRKNKDEKSNPFFAGLDYFPDGRLAVIDSNNMKLHVYEDKLQLLGSFDLPYCPFDIVVFSEVEVAITALKRIFFLHVNKANKITLIRTVIVKSKIDSICMMDDRHFTTGVHRTSKPACILSLTGEENDFNLDFLKIEYKAMYSYCTFLKYNNKLVITDNDENTVTIYDIATNTSVIVNDDRIKEPRGMAVGPFECIFVCSRLTGSIVQISPNGDIVATHRLDMVNPFRICFSKDKTRLAVSNNLKGSYKWLVFRVDFCSH